METSLKAEELPSPIAVLPLLPAVEQIPVAETPIVTAMPVSAAPDEIKSVEPKPAAARIPHSLERIRRIAVTQHASEIPIVPDRVEPKLFLYRPAPPKQRIRGPKKSYKVAFQSGPKLWRTASVTLALLVLAGLVATVVAVRPPVAVPPKPKPVTSANPALFLPSAQASTTDASHPGAAPAASLAGGRKTIAGPASPSASQRNPAAAPRHRSASDDGRIAEDTVIFYNRKPAQHEAKLPPTTDVKRYSE
jgi:hypothetical protein